MDMTGSCAANKYRSRLGFEDGSKDDAHGHLSNKYYEASPMPLHRPRFVCRHTLGEEACSRIQRNEEYIKRPQPRATCRCLCIDRASCAGIPSATRPVHAVDETVSAANVIDASASTELHVQAHPRRRGWLTQSRKRRLQQTSPLPLLQPGFMCMNTLGEEAYSSR